MTETESALLTLAQRVAAEAAALPAPAHPIGATVAVGGIVVRVSIARGSVSGRAFTDADLDILQVIDVVKPGQRLKGKAIARMTGYKYSGWLAAKLTTMVRDGLIVSHGSSSRQGGYGPVARPDNA